MTPSTGSLGDPFADPSTAAVDGEYIEGATLPVGRTASLTLATDSLILLDEDLSRGVTSNCCNLLPSKPKTTQAIPFFNILWAELSDFDVTIQYAKSVSKKHVRVATIKYLVEKPQQTYAQSWVARLLYRAYGESQRHKRIKVLVNPFGGSGRAHKWFVRDVEPIFLAARCQIDMERTMYRGHAVEIAEKLDTDAYDVVASCSGDGLPHEVFNGFGKRADAVTALSKVAVVQLPCGTGNAMSWNLNGTDSTSVAALCIVKGIRTPLDLISITQGERRTLSFLSQSLGIVADVDLGTEHLRWMGSARFSYGFLIRLLRKTVYPVELAVNIEIGTKAQIKDHYRQELGNRASIEQRRGIKVRSEDETSSSHESNDLMGLPRLSYGTVLSPIPSSFTIIPGARMGNFYAGNMALMAPGANFFPATLPSDGHIDLVTIDGDISRVAAIKSFLAVENGCFFDMPHVGYRKISGYRISPRQKGNGYISIDGERFPFEPFQAEVHKGLGTVLSRNGSTYEADGVVAKNIGTGSRGGDGSLDDGTPK